MLGGLYGLNYWQQASLFSIQQIPSLAALLGLYCFKDGLATLILLQITYILFPALYIYFISKEGELGAYFLNEMNGKSLQIKQGLSLCGSAFGMVLLAYANTYYFEDTMINMMNFPFSKNILYLIFFLLIFTIINPLLEEWFWRLFLLKTYKESEFYRMKIAISYTILHIAVLYNIFSWEWALGFGTYFYSVGRAFEHIKEKYGLITCLMTHYGLTFATSIVLTIILVVKSKNGQL